LCRRQSSANPRISFYTFFPYELSSARKEVRSELHNLPGNMPTIVDELEPFFNPNVAACIGASRDLVSVSGFVVKNIVDGGFRGKLYLVNPNSTSNIMGLKTVSKVSRTKENIDCAIFTLPAKYVPETMEECVSQNVKTAIIISAGFGEVDESGKKLENELTRIARKGGMRFSGPNCNGVYSATSSFSAILGPVRPLPGSIAFVSQGGSPGVIVHGLMLKTSPFLPIRPSTQADNNLVFLKDTDQLVEETK